jgi:hypothetical protein
MFRTISLAILLMANCFTVLSQNLIINPGAELTPSGTGWIIASTGANTCAIGSAAATYSNWTMTPDNSANYPAAHGGTKTFFAGCNTAVPGGPFELYQDIDVSADAVQIDAGLISYIFSGYIQTPVSPQADAGRFIVDYLDAGGAIIGTSYTTAYQSFAGGSGTAWVQYMNTRTAASGTRKLRTRLQVTIATGPAINTYFDDISITKAVITPLTLISFSGRETSAAINLKWSVGDAVNFSKFEIDKSTDALNFAPAGTIEYVNRQRDYYFTDKYITGQTRLYYRLKMIDADDHFVYSHTLVFSPTHLMVFTISPNPATNVVMITGLRSKGSIIIRNMIGIKVLESTVFAGSFLPGINLLPKGIYAVSYWDGNSLTTQQLILQ